MTDSYVTEDEVDAMGANVSLKRTSPFMIRFVSQTQFSIARHYGAINYNGESYTYLPETDELIRDDVLEFVTKLRKPKKTKKSATKQKALFNHLSEQGT